MMNSFASSIEEHVQQPPQQQEVEEQVQKQEREDENEDGEVEEVAAEEVVEPEFEPEWFENEIVFVKQGKFPWWPAYILKQVSPDKCDVCFGYDPKVRQFGQILTKHIVRMRLIEPDEDIATQWYELAATDTKSKKSKKKKAMETTRADDMKEAIEKVKKKKLPKGLMENLEKAQADLAIWVSQPDKRASRHCLCQQLDDGSFMFGCALCDTCWFHPECLDMEISAEQRADPSLIPPFPCPFVDQPPHCKTCVAKYEAEQEAKRKAMEAEKRKESFERRKLLKRARDEEKTKALRAERRRMKRQRKAERMQRVLENPDITETDTSEVEATTDEETGNGVRGDSRSSSNSSSLLFNVNSNAPAPTTTPQFSSE